MAPDSQNGPRPRRRYVDWARGIAVLIMIEAHTLDAWTRPSDRSTYWFQRLTMLGGFAAPLFLWLAGLSLVLAAQRTYERSGSRATATNAIVRRGVEIFILAFLFRLQAFIVSPGSWPVTIFRVDILNILGPAIACAGLVWGLSRGSDRAAAACAAVAIGIAMVTPIVRTAQWVDALPMWIRWYIRPFGDQTTFTLFPWAGFVFAGAAVGSLFPATQNGAAERRLLAAVGAAGAALLWIGFYTASRPSIYPTSSFWTTSPSYFVIRVGAMLLALAVLAVAAWAWGDKLPGVAVIERFGRNSLFVYWIHVDLVYGYATWVIRRRLPLWGTALAFIAFTVAMYAAIVAKDRVVERRQARGARNSAPKTVPA